MFALNETVLVWIDTRWYEGIVTRVYNEETYRQEHYPNGVNPHYNDTANLALYDVLVSNGYRISTAHFEHGLKKIIADPPKE